MEEILTQPPNVIHTDIVLVGGGHTHVQVLKSFGMKPMQGVRLTLIAKELFAPYSGMLPGLIAGQYSFEECHIDLVRLARFANARLIHGAANAVDRERKQLKLDARPPIAYDLLSIDVGITPDLAHIQGADAYAIAVKPISTFWPKWQSLQQKVLEPDGPRRLAIIGDGAAGFELALAIDHCLRTVMAQHGRSADGLAVTLIAGDRLLPTHSARARQLAYSTLKERGISLFERDRAVSVSKRVVELESGLAIASDAILVATGAAAPTWFHHTDLPTDLEGYLKTRSTLQLVDDDAIFAVGDCATISKFPREKSGVFAVRQGPTLISNLKRLAVGRDARPYIPQKYFLTLLSLANGTAIAAKGRLVGSGRWAWQLKDAIDRRFMKKFNLLPDMVTGGGGVNIAQMRCGGCAAKVGPKRLANVLDRLHKHSGSAPEDASIIDNGGPSLTLQSIDFFRAFWPDPYVLGQVAANHALNDVFAMGGTPRQALALAVVPYGKPRKIEEDLFQLLAGSGAVLERENVALTGGHSGEGAELAIGFSVTGDVDRDAILTKSGLQDGDRLILTKPLGTGVAFAGEMNGKARATTIIAALRSMLISNRQAAVILQRYGARAMTDVTGFGLAGHLLEMLEGSHLKAELKLNQIPLLPGVVALSQAGIASTLLPENLLKASAIETPERLSRVAATLLFDPQTAGGLLAGIREEKAQACLEALRSANYEAAIIGHVTKSTHAAIKIANGFQDTLDDKRAANESTPRSFTESDHANYAVDRYIDQKSNGRRANTLFFGNTGSG